jgi:pimeloyl-ACP methyl ester carboxylesterase
MIAIGDDRRSLADRAVRAGTVESARDDVVMATGRAAQSGPDGNARVGGGCRVGGRPPQSVPRMDVEVGPLRIAYDRAGSGPPVVLVHGFVGDGRSTWAAQLAALADEFAVVAWDAPGAGGSSAPPDGFGIEDYADALAGFLRALGIRRGHLVGLSFGGALVLATFHRHPGLAATLSLVGGYAGWSGSLGVEAARQRLERSLELSALPPDAFADAMVPSMFASSARTPAMQRFVDSVRAFDPAGFRAMARASFVDQTHVLAGVDVPTLLLYADHDVRAPLAVGEALHAAISTSELVVLEGPGHASPVEAPDAVTGALRGFFRAHPPGNG